MELDFICSFNFNFAYTCLDKSTSRCEQFAARKCTVYATSRRVETIGDFANPGVHKLALDVTNANDIQEAIQTIVRKEGRIDVVVNCAGVLGISECEFATLKLYSH